MVDALHSVHRVLRRGGILVDIRPSTKRLPRLERQGRVFARLVPTDHTRHRLADAAIAGLVDDGLFRPARSGHFWFRHTFPDRASLRAWLEERDDWAAPRGTDLTGATTLRRAVEFTHYEKR